MKTHIKMYDLGVFPIFLETPVWVARYMHHLDLGPQSSTGGMMKPMGIISVQVFVDEDGMHAEELEASKRFLVFERKTHQEKILHLKLVAFRF